MQVCCKSDDFVYKGFITKKLSKQSEECVIKKVQR